MHVLLDFGTDRFVHGCRVKDLAAITLDDGQNLAVNGYSGSPKSNAGRQSDWRPQTDFARERAGGDRPTHHSA
jgi:hypothetical protein